MTMSITIGNTRMPGKSPGKGIVNGTRNTSFQFRWIERENQRVERQHQAAPAVVVMAGAGFRHRPEPPRSIEGNPLDSRRRLIFAFHLSARDIEPVELTPAQSAARHPPPAGGVARRT